MIFRPNGIVSSSCRIDFDGGHLGHRQVTSPHKEAEEPAGLPEAATMPALRDIHGSGVSR